MKITVTGNGTCGLNFGELSKKHLGHDLDRDHDNSYLKTAQSKYDRQFNQSKTLFDFDKENHKRFDAQFDEIQKKAEKNRHRLYKNLTEYQLYTQSGKRRTTTETHLNVNTGQTNKNKVEAYPYESYVQKLGEKATWEKWLSDSIKKVSEARKIDSKQARDLLMRMVSDSLAEHAEGFNQRHSMVKMDKYVVHMDEKGAPHYHDRFMGLAKTAGGKNSWNVPLALAKEAESAGKNVAKVNQKGYKSYNQHSVWAYFHEVEDQSLLDVLNKNIEKDFKDCQLDSFELVRKTKDNPNLPTNIAHKDYIQMKEVAETEKAKEISAKLRAKMADLSRLEAEDKLESVQNQINQLKQDSNQWVDETNRKLLNALQVKLDTVKAREDAVKAREDKITAKETALDHRENGYEDKSGKHVDGLKDRENKLTTAKKQFEDRKEAENQKLADRESALDARETDLNAIELGGKDSKGVQHEGLVARKSKLDDREDSLSNWADDLAETGSTLESAVQAFTDGFYQGMTNDNTATTEVENLPSLLMSSVTRPFAMVAGFRRGIKKLLKVVKESKFLKTLNGVTEHLRLENERQENLQQQQYNKASYKGMKMPAKTATASKQEPKPKIKEKSDDFGPEF